MSAKKVFKYLLYMIIFILYESSFFIHDLAVSAIILGIVLVLMMIIFIMKQREYKALTEEQKQELLNKKSRAKVVNWLLLIIAFTIFLPILFGLIRSLSGLY